MSNVVNTILNLFPNLCSIWFKYVVSSNEYVVLRVQYVVITISKNYVFCVIIKYVVLGDKYVVLGVQYVVML